MTTVSRAEVLLSDYNKYRGMTYHFQQIKKIKKYLKDIGTKKGLPSMEKLEQWCLKNSIDPRRFLYHQFKIRNWLFAPTLLSLTPSKTSAKKRIATYQEMKETPVFTDVIYQAINIQRHHEGTIFDRNRDLSPMAEAMKSRYLAVGRANACMDQMDEYTYGFHPKSRSCLACSLSQQCLAKLQQNMAFDVVALRNGALSLQEAQVITSRANV